jgi:hypothetical protein
MAPTADGLEELRDDRAGRDTSGGLTRRSTLERTADVAIEVAVGSGEIDVTRTRTRRLGQRRRSCGPGSRTTNTSGEPIVQPRRTPPTICTRSVLDALSTAAPRPTLTSAQRCVDTLDVDPKPARQSFEERGDLSPVGLPAGPERQTSQHAVPAPRGSAPPLPTSSSTSSANLSTSNGFERTNATCGWFSSRSA